MKVEQQTGLSIGLIVMLLIVIMNISKSNIAPIEIYNHMFEEKISHNIEGTKLNVEIKKTIQIDLNDIIINNSEEDPEKLLKEWNKGQDIRFINNKIEEKVSEQFIESDCNKILKHLDITHNQEHKNALPTESELMKAKINTKIKNIDIYEKQSNKITITDQGEHIQKEKIKCKLNIQKNIEIITNEMYKGNNYLDDIKIWINGTFYEFLTKQEYEDYKVNYKDLNLYRKVIRKLEWDHAPIESNNNISSNSDEFDQNPDHDTSDEVQ